MVEENKYENVFHDFNQSMPFIVFWSYESIMNFSGLGSSYMLSCTERLQVSICILNPCSSAYDLAALEAKGSLLLT